MRVFVDGYIVKVFQKGFDFLQIPDKGRSSVIFVFGNGVQASLIKKVRVEMDVYPAADGRLIYRKTDKELQSVGT